uniref:Putative terminase n=2 Tax=viral metagenome TaxID=1070528 RepID=A0A6M3K5T2_9ZZZZ
MPSQTKPKQQDTMQADSAPATIDTDDEATLEQHQDAYRVAQPFITPAMHAFAEHWALNRNQVKAFQHAYPGSSANSARLNARRLFADDRVQAEIRRVIEAWSEKSGVTIAQLEHELARLARSDIRRVFDRGFVLRDPHDWDADTAAAVSSYSETVSRQGITRKVRFHDKHAAARTLLEAKGAFEKHKAPPGAAAIFNINMGNGQSLHLGVDGANQGRTIDQAGGASTRKGEKRPQRVLAHPGVVSKSRQKVPKQATKAARAPVTVESTTPAAADPPAPASSSPAKPPLF